MQNKVIENILTRTSVRSFTSEPVSEADVQTMLRAAMAAPSAKNRQSWEFVVVDDRSVLDTLASGLTYAKMLFEAPLAIVICSDVSNRFWEQDASAACENLLLCAHSLGLGAVWTNASDPERSQIVRETLGLPDNIAPLSVVPVGHPSGMPEPKDKWKPEKIHYNKW